MNIELLESFGQNYPEEFDGTLDCISMAITCSFNRWGTLLAVGCNDGRIVIWDFLTRGISKIISAHVHPVCSLCWSRDGKKILSASTDNTVAIWDVLTGESSFILAIRSRFSFVPCATPQSWLISRASTADLNIIASFDRRGDHIYTGNGRGKILVLNSSTLEVVASFRISQGNTSSTAVRSIEFSRRGSNFLVNSGDRIIRVYDAKEILACGKDGDPEPVQRLQDLVNKTTWKKCCFSGDGEYICAGSARQHALYIWERSIGNLVKILHGTKGELLLDVVWHPVRPIIASVSSGVVSLWAQYQVENWSAFAPDFKELDENVEYEERESEFDIADEDKSVTQNERKEEEDVEVDVTTEDPVAAYCSSDEENVKEALMYLPIAPEVEDPEEGWAPGAEGGEEDANKRDPSSQKENDSPKRKKAKTYDIQLPSAPTDEIHPMLSSKAKDKQQSLGGKKGSTVGRPRTSDGKRMERGRSGKQ
nr:EOG090X04Y3 [Eulimnadia texana]